MKKTLALAAFTLLFAAQSFATYIVVLKDGHQYKAKAKWTMANGKALVQLENGQTLAIDPTLIDEAKSDQTTKLGLGNVNVISLDPNMPAATAPKSQGPSLGSTIHLRKLGEQQQAAPAPTAQVATPAPAQPAGGGAVNPEVVEKFERAYENVGIFEHKLTTTGAHTLRAELTADNEDKVFNAISATSFLMVRNAGVPGAQVDMVELFLKMTNGGAAGRFQMTRDDATALDTKKISQQEYFVRKVIY
jgi:hypothetical protein